MITDSGVSQGMVDHYRKIAWTAYSKPQDAEDTYVKLGYKVIIPRKVSRLEEFYILFRGTQMVVTVAGTNELMDWLRNFWSFKAALHPGYERGANALLGEVMAGIKTYESTGAKIDQIIFTGHSKGAGVAGVLKELMAAYCQRRGIASWVLSYDGPRYLSAALAKTCDKRYIVRVVKEFDIVPRVPMSRHGWQHVGECWVDTGNHTYLIGQEEWDKVKKKHSIWKLLLLFPWAIKCHTTY
jgi:hypothetical protein